MKTPQRPKEKPYSWMNDHRYYDFQKSLKWITYFGELQYGPTFKIRREDWSIIYRLLIYTIRDEKACDKLGIDLGKGILLTGPIGCGKTSLMQLMRQFTYIETGYNVIQTREIAAAFNQQGYEVIDKYGKRPKIYCFDDLGVEQSQKYFGSDCNTMSEILMARYELQINLKVVTHATTNLNAQELENAYGNRVRSRLRSMFNLISFPASSSDKRK